MTAQPGLNVIMWPADQFVGTLNMRIQQVFCKTDTKTKDNVAISVGTAIQYHVLTDEVEKAYYKLTNVEQQIQSYVDDVVRASIPKLTLDEAYENKDHVANDVKDALQSSMDDYGYNIVKALV